MPSTHLIAFISSDIEPFIIILHHNPCLRITETMGADGFQKEFGRVGPIELK
jgi:hypothetical protein